MYVCKTCNISFKRVEDYNNHYTNIKHYVINESDKNNSPEKNNMNSQLTISTDSLCSLEHKVDKDSMKKTNNNNNNKETIIKLNNVKSKLNKLMNEIDEIINDL